MFVLPLAGSVILLRLKWSEMADTLPETNSKFAPENGCLEYDRFLKRGKRPILSIFQGRWLLVLGSHAHYKDSVEVVSTKNKSQPSVELWPFATLLMAVWRTTSQHFSPISTVGHSKV